MATYIEVVIECRKWQSERVSDELLALGSAGTSIQDIQDVLDLPREFGEWVTDDLLKRYPKYPLVHGYFADEALTDVKKRLEQQFLKAGMPLEAADYTIHPLEETDWSENWKQYYRPVRLSHWLAIVPAWEKQANDDPNTIYLNPGMAFGTGSHPTTRLTVNLMEIALKPGDTMIDVGTGSGILALVGAKLGAKEVYAYDYDESVIDTVHENIQLNPGITNITVGQKDKLNGVTQQVDMITANILADILLPLIPEAANCLVDDGALLLSGIFRDQFEPIMAALKANDFYVLEYRRAGDWYAIYARKGRQYRPKDSL
ncbi:MAG: 50S ribosomal protein L11 methyltransferase [Aerococcus sp.]|nr:50S ribosomal protein L11 methyltransferase [Aerococcus sp.]